MTQVIELVDENPRSIIWRLPWGQSLQREPQREADWWWPSKPQKHQEQEWSAHRHRFRRWFLARPRAPRAQRLFSTDVDGSFITFGLRMELMSVIQSFETRASLRDREGTSEFEQSPLEHQSIQQSFKNIVHSSTLSGTKSALLFIRKIAHSESVITFLFKPLLCYLLSIPPSISAL